MIVTRNFNFHKAYLNHLLLFVTLSYLACARWGVVQHRFGFVLDLGLVILALVLAWLVWSWSHDFVLVLFTSLK